MVSTSLAMIKPLIHIKVKDLGVRSENCIFLLSMDGMVYRWGSHEVDQLKPYPLLSLIDFTIKSIRVSKE